MIVGIDTGGTFTDVFIIRDGSIDRFKLPSTPDDPSVVFRNTLEKIDAMYPDEKPDVLVYGSTVATNALLEDNLSKTCFVTNKGFEDVFRLGRQNRPADSLYSPVPPQRKVPVPRERVLGIDVRQGHGGKVEHPLEAGDLSDLVLMLDDIDAEAVGIGLLHSYADPSVELFIADALRRAGFKVCASGKIDPNPYEYERFTTTAVNAGLMPLMGSYLGKLDELTDAELLIMQSNGGVASADEVAEYPIRLLLSGPAGGVMALELLAEWTGGKKLIGFDMGGTSTDIAIHDGASPFRQQLDLAGLPIRCPSLDIQTVGAGGGSIVRIDPGGALEVGPQSAGADPGPACYGNGGPLTLTDCNLWGGRLASDIRLAGTMKLDSGASEKALCNVGGDVLNPDALAEGALKVVAAVMAGAVRRAARERGVDPSEFTLVSFGGAGGLHASDLANEVGIKRILIPRDAGVFSALGMSFTRQRRDEMHHVGLRWERDADPSEILDAIGDLVPEISSGEEVVVNARCRYPGQRFTIELEFGPDLPKRFDEEHERRFGISRPDAPVEIVTVVVSVLGKKPDIGAPLHVPAEPDYAVPDGAIAWDLLKEGERIQGPAMVVGREASAWVPGGCIAEVDAMGNLRMEVGR